MEEFIKMSLKMLLQASPILVVLAVLNHIGKIQKKREVEREEERKKGVIRKKYTVRTENVIIFICVISAIIFSSATIICTIQQEDLAVICIFGIFALVGLFGTLNTMLWKLDINGDEITWRSTFGRKRTFRFEDITYCEEKDSGAVRVYVDGKKLFTIDSNIDMEEFMEDVKRRRVSVKSYYLNQMKKKSSKKRW